VDFARFPVEHGDARLLDDAAHFASLVGFEIVVAKNGDGWNAHGGVLSRQDVRLVGVAMVRQVPSQQQEIGCLGDLGEHRLKGALGGSGAVQVSHGRDADRVVRHAALSLSRRCEIRMGRALLYTVRLTISVIERMSASESPATWRRLRGFLIGSAHDVELRSMVASRGSRGRSSSRARLAVCSAATPTSFACRTA
jgi:hypothetical protein